VSPNNCAIEAVAENYLDVLEALLRVGCGDNESQKED
jgi:hypothetical protein